MPLAILQNNASALFYAGRMEKLRPNTQESLRKNLKRLMEVQKISQAELARRSGISQTHIGGILRGESSATVEIADALARPLGTNGWIIIKPDLPDELLISSALRDLVDGYCNADTAGREFIDAALKMTIAKKK